jgi:GNAT superfamily N-acetyltransferase
MNNNPAIKQSDPASPAARTMMNALWEEIQTRHGFKSTNPFDPASFAVTKACFWVAFANNEPVGSIAIAPLSEHEAELDIMYVAPCFRGSGIAQELMASLEKHAIENDFTIIKLRAGAPQPEALRFYEKAGFTRIAAFGKWINDNTAICFQKKLI